MGQSKKRGQEKKEKLVEEERESFGQRITERMKKKWRSKRSSDDGQKIRRTKKRRKKRTKSVGKKQEGRRKRGKQEKGNNAEEKHEKAAKYR